MLDPLERGLHRFPLAIVELLCSHPSRILGAPTSAGAQRGEQETLAQHQILAETTTDVRHLSSPSFSSSEPSSWPRIRNSGQSGETLIHGLQHGCR
jgi:hypothetical protein